MAFDYIGEAIDFTIDDSKLLAAIMPKEYAGQYSYKGVDYNNLIQISEYPSKILLIPETYNIRDGEVVIVEELEEFVLATLTEVFFIEGVPRCKHKQARVSIVTLAKKAKNVKGKLAVEAMTYKLGDILDDGSVVCDISNRWRKKGSDKTMEYIYREFRKARR